jgi:hypothetical protein
MDVGWVLPEEFTGSGSLRTLARTTTDRVRLGGTTTGRFLAECDDHTTRLAQLSGQTKRLSIYPSDKARSGFGRSVRDSMIESKLVFLQDFAYLANIPKNWKSVYTIVLSIVFNILSSVTSSINLRMSGSKVTAMIPAEMSH